MKANYHYEWFLYTDNLCEGRRMLAQADTLTELYWKRKFVSLNGIDPYMGATTIEKHRVYNR